MQVHVARISPVLVEVAVEVPADAVRAEVDKAYATLQRRARVRGFRPGKAPRQVLARLYGPQVASDVASAIVSDTLPRALSNNNVQPVNQPRVEAGKVEQGSAFTYKARFEVSPEITEILYEGLELVRPSVAPTEAMVEEQLELLRKAHARLEPPDPVRPAQKGDVITVDFTLSVDGVELKDAAGQDVQLELGSGQVLPELDAALVGRGVDDELDATAVLPAGHPRPELRSKAAAFHVKVKDVKQRVLPALDDEFAKDVGSFQTLVELRADIHTRLQKMLKDRADAVLAEQIVEKLSEKNSVDLPPSLVEQQCRLMELEVVQTARRLGKQPPTKDDLAKMHDVMHVGAEKKVRAGLIMAAIAKKQGMQVTEDDIRKGIEELASETGKNVAKVRAEYSDPQRKNILVGMILEDRVLNLIESKAVIREGDAPLTPPGWEHAPSALAQAEEEAAAAGADADANQETTSDNPGG
jgi:trigger factor